MKPFQIRILAGTMQQVSAERAVFRLGGEARMLLIGDVIGMQTSQYA